MPRRTSIWTHWTLFAVAMVGAAWLVVVGFLNLDNAYAQGDLNRQTLYESLTYLAGVLCLLWAAGWLLASRPKSPPRSRFEGYTYA